MLLRSLPYVPQNHSGVFPECPQSMLLMHEHLYVYCTTIAYIRTCLSSKLGLFMAGVATHSFCIHHTEPNVGWAEWMKKRENE